MIVDFCLASLTLIWLFVLLGLSFWNWKFLFLGRRGRLHRVLGLAEFGVLTACFLDLVFPIFGPWLRFAFDVGLGLIGASLAFSALAFDHEKVHRLQRSGTLDEHALVSNSEMVEHVFFQLLNSCQVKEENRSVHLLAVKLTIG